MYSANKKVENWVCAGYSQLYPRSCGSDKLFSSVIDHLNRFEGYWGFELVFEVIPVMLHPLIMYYVDLLHLYSLV